MHFHYAEYVCKNPHFNRKYSTEHSNARTGRSLPEHLTCGPITDFMLMIGLNSIANGGRQIHTSHRGSFLRNWNLFCYFIGLLTVNIYFNWGRRKVNIVSHLLPVSVLSIVSREIILLPAALIPLPEEANRSRP